MGFSLDSAITRFLHQKFTTILPLKNSKKFRGGALHPKPENKTAVMSAGGGCPAAKILATPLSPDDDDDDDDDDDGLRSPPHSASLRPHASHF